MIRLLGGSVFVICVMLWGSEKAASLTERQKLTKAFAALILFCEERISVFSDPLGVIFAAFENDVLERYGIISVLRDQGCRAAVKTALPMLDDEDAALLSEFSEKIGGGSKSAQLALCRYTASRLDEAAHKQLDELAGKVKVYRLLPALAALSAVILFI